MKQPLLISTLFFLATQTALAAKPGDLEDGLWELRAEVATNGTAMPPVVTKQCISKNDLVPAAMPRTASCKSDVATAGDRVVWKMKCEITKGMEIEYDGWVRYDGATMRGVATTRTSGANLPAAVEGTMKFTGKRIGPCTNKP